MTENNENNETKTSLLNKTQDELTVKDNLKLTAVVVGGAFALMAIPAVVAGGAEAIKIIRHNRQVRKAEAELAREAEVIETQATEK